MYISSHSMTSVDKMQNITLDERRSEVEVEEIKLLGHILTTDIRTLKKYSTCARKLARECTFDED